MIIEWNDSFEIGHAVIDAEHRRLFELANQFNAARSKADLTQCAMQLYQHTRLHFEHEEALMRSVHFEPYASHVASHDEFITLLNATSEAIANDTLKKGEVLSLMTSWALEHIPHHDARLTDYLHTA
jgi:hemerythrin